MGAGRSRNQAEPPWSLMCLKLKILLWCLERTPLNTLAGAQGSPHHLLEVSFLLSPPHTVSLCLCYTACTQNMPIYSTGFPKTHITVTFPQRPSLTLCALFFSPPSAPWAYLPPLV